MKGGREGKASKGELALALTLTLTLILTLTLTLTLTHEAYLGFARAEREKDRAKFERARR